MLNKILNKNIMVALKEKNKTPNAYSEFKHLRYSLTASSL